MLVRLDVARQIRTDDLPVQTAVRSLKYDVRAEPGYVRIPGSKRDRRIPVEAIRLRIQRKVGRRSTVPGPDGPAQSGTKVHDAKVAALRIRPYQIRIRWIGHGPHAIAAHDPSPRGIENAVRAQAIRRAAKTIVVLQRRAHPVWIAIVKCRVVDLSDCDVLRIRPGVAAVQGERVAAVFAHQDALG